MQTNLPKISVIVVNFNGKKWLETCIHSLKKQTYPNLEIVIVDNNSSDESCEYLEKNFPEVLLVKSSENKGFAGGNNLGIKACSGELVLFLNNDAKLNPDAIENLFNEKEEKNLDIIGPFEANYDGSIRKPYQTQIDYLGHTINNKSAQKSFYLSGVCILFSKKLYQETGGLDEDFFMYFEEIDWFWRLILEQKSFAYSFDTFVFHAGAGSSGSGIKYLSFLWRNQNTLQMLLKNYKIHNLIWVLPLYFAVNIAEMIFFLVIFKPKISLSYLQGWWFNIKMLPKTLSKRSHIQAMRKVSDKQIMSHMYPLSAKLHHLFVFFSKK
jgi:GT2 family glycosyltransferase